MTIPVCRVYLALGYGPLDTVVIWTEVTDYLAPIPVRFRRGRNDQSVGQPAAPGSATFTLESYNRMFDPSYTAGVYYGQLRPRVQVKITGQRASGSEVDRFRGWVSGFPHEIDGDEPLRGRVQIVAYDRIEWAGGANLTSDLYGDTFNDLALYVGGGDVWLRQVDNGRWLNGVTTDNGAVTVGTFTPGSSLGAGLPSKSVGGGSVWFQLANSITASAGVAWVFACWFSTTGTAAVIGLRSRSAGGSVNTVFEITGSGKFRWATYDGTNTSGLTSTDVLNDGVAHMVVVTCNGTTPKMYVDGVEDLTATSETAGAGNLAFGIERLLGNGDTSGPDYSTPVTKFPGQVQELFVSTASGVWSASDVAEVYGVGAGFLPESAGDRLTRLAAIAGFPSAWLDIATDTRATVGRLATAGQTFLAAAREVERSEQGRLFAAKDGKLTFLSRYWHQEHARGTTVQATFSDDGSDFAYEGHRYGEADTDVRNVVTVTTPTASKTSTDATSVTDYGPQPLTVDTILSTAEQATTMADGLVYWWKGALGRIAPFDVDTVALTNAEWDTLFGLELGDRIQVEATPSGVGTQMVRQLLLDSIEEEITPGSRWRVRLAAGPVPPSFFVIGTDTLDAGVLGF